MDADARKQPLEVDAGDMNGWKEVRSDAQRPSRRARGLVGTACNHAMPVTFLSPADDYCVSGKQTRGHREVNEGDMSGALYQRSGKYLKRTHTYSSIA